MFAVTPQRSLYIYLRISTNSITNTITKFSNYPGFSNTLDEIRAAEHGETLNLTAIAVDIKIGDKIALL